MNNDTQYIAMIAEALLRTASLFFVPMTFIIGWYLSNPSKFDGDKSLREFWRSKSNKKVVYWIGGIIFLLNATIGNDGSNWKLLLGMCIVFGFNFYRRPETMRMKIKNALEDKPWKQFYRQPEKKGFFIQIDGNEGVDTLHWFIIRMILVAIAATIVLSIF